MTSIMPSPIAATPEPPYYAVIFTSLRTDGDNGYDAVAQVMEESAARQDGFLGVESARDGLGITVSYWRDLAAIAAWKQAVDHLVAQKLGHKAYRVRIARVERAYGFGLEDEHASAAR